MGKTTRKFDVAVIHLAAMRDQETCVIAATTTNGEVVYLNLSGEGLLALPNQVGDLLKRCPEIADWHTAPGP